MTQTTASLMTSRRCSTDMWRFSLSTRLLEGPLIKTGRAIDLLAIADVAASLGYDAMCLRPAQLSGMAGDEAHELAEKLALKGLGVSLVTPTVEVVANTPDAGPQLAAIGRQLDLAEALGAGAIRVHVPASDYIGAAQRACDAAQERGLRLLQQTHANSPFETLESAAAFVRRINRENFGLIVEPVNLLLCGQWIYGGVLARCAESIVDVHVQNVQLDSGTTRISTARGERMVNHVPLGCSQGVDMNWLWKELRELDFTGFITVHQPALSGHSWQQTASDSLRYLRGKEGEL